MHIILCSSLQKFLSTCNFFQVLMLRKTWKVDLLNPWTNKVRTEIMFMHVHVQCIYCRVPFRGGKPWDFPSPPHQISPSRIMDLVCINFPYPAVLGSHASKPFCMKHCIVHILNFILCTCRTKPEYQCW